LKKEANLLVRLIAAQAEYGQVVKLSKQTFAQVFELVAAQIQIS